MTDDQWSSLTSWLKVPSTARAPIENELDLYARVAASGNAPPPSEVRSKLEHAAALASELLEAIEKLGPKEIAARSAGITGTPREIARLRAATLFPSVRIVCGVGPTNRMPSRARASANSGLSDRNP